MKATFVNILEDHPKFGVDEKCAYCGEHTKITSVFAAFLTEKVHEGSVKENSCTWQFPVHNWDLIVEVAILAKLKTVLVHEIGTSHERTGPFALFFSQPPNKRQIRR